MKFSAAVASTFAVCLLAALPVAHAGEKKVKFKVKNDTGAPLELKIGDKIETLQPDQMIPVKLPMGTKIVTDTATGHYRVGDVITVVSDSIPSDATLSIGK